MHQPAWNSWSKDSTSEIRLTAAGVCYAFFYIDKTTLSYAAIFGIRDDLNLKGQEYSWLSSIVSENPVRK